MPHHTASVGWLFSFLSADKRKTYCLYEAQDAEPIREAAKRLNAPGDVIVELGTCRSLPTARNCSLRPAGLTSGNPGSRLPAQEGRDFFLEGAHSEPARSSEGGIQQGKSALAIDRTSAHKQHIGVLKLSVR